MKDLLYKALSYYGLEEIPGEKNNPEILSFFKALGHDWVQSELISWCSAFIDYIARELQYERANSLVARDWLKVGVDIPIPDIGDIVVLWRESPLSWKGHVGLFIREMHDKVYLLGGNQNDSVCIKAYPKERVLGYRQLRKKYSFLNYFDDED